MKILGPRLINNDEYLLYIDSEDTAMDPTQYRKRKLSSSPCINDQRNDLDSPESNQSPPKSGGKRQRKSKVLESFLGKEYKPKPRDVICARGKEAASHPGNVQFRLMIDHHLNEYRSTETKKAKTAIVCKIIDSVRSSSPKGRFVRKHSNGHWYETGDDFAREKVGQCLRDRLHTEYRSSSKAKISRRKEGINPGNKPMDFDEFVASPDPCLQNPLPLVTPSVRLQQSSGESTKWEDVENVHMKTPPACGDFTVAARKVSNFRGLADMYFGDGAQASNASASSTTDPQYHLDLLGSFKQSSSQGSMKMFHGDMRSQRTDQSIRGQDVGKIFQGTHFTGHTPEMTYHRRRNPLRFAVHPTDSSPRNPPSAFGGENNVSSTPNQDSVVDPSQQLLLPTMGHKRSDRGGFNVEQMSVSKGLGYLYQSPNWQTRRTNRKPPPMPPSIFDTSFANPTLARRNDPFDVQPGRSMSITKPPPQGLDSSEQSSTIPDDEPLPLDS